MTEAQKDMTDQNTFDAVAQVTTVAGAASSVATVHLGLSDWLAIGSLAITALGFVMQALLALRRIRIEDREYARRSQEYDRERLIDRAERADDRRQAAR